MAIEASVVLDSVVLTPIRWRFWASVGMVSATALAIIAFLLVYPGAARVMWFLVFIIPGILTVMYAGARSRSVRIVPGGYLEYRDVFFRLRRIESDASTEIVYFASVVGSGSIPIREFRTPIGVNDERWAVIRSGKKTVLRLSMRLWRMNDLVAIAQAMPARLRVHSESISPLAVAKRQPDYYTWLEHRPIRYEIGFLAFLLWEASAILLAIVLACLVLGTL
ncbi:hypothetical protein E3O25_14215 [Cryobacterium sp. TMT1-3]|uniref:hypothetical protein n=1 Tax=Cryobacterium sp. TMT1-3 TaxID=1259237 RepID=UPI00106C066D|nr:hypothetical protein [Cryobacterium sp. TMT1-3]TFC25151.1 hypothetical protein E3O25_14215 [Cryobacterium sp. TMT1-3]